MNVLKPWHWAIILTIIALWFITLMTTFIAIWVGPWQMTVTACVFFLIAFCASFAIIAVMDDLDSTKRNRR